MKRLVPAAVWGGLGIALGIAIAAGIGSMTRHESVATVLETPDDYGSLPDFDLTDRSGRRVTRDSLIGSYWVADFIFTRCSGMCPLLTSRMAALSAEIPEDVRLVSFTVDPEHDTPAVLRRYAEEIPAAGEDRDRWLFLTGDREGLHGLIGTGFRLAVDDNGSSAAGPAAPVPAGERITHSDRFVLVDPEGRIRGYYRGTDPESIARLVVDLGRLRDDATR